MRYKRIAVKTFSLNQGIIDLHKDTLDVGVLREDL